MGYYAKHPVQRKDYLQTEGERHTLERYRVRKEKESWSNVMHRRHHQTEVDVQKFFRKRHPWVVDKLYSFQRSERCIAAYEFLAWDASEKRLAFAKCFLLPRLAPIRDLYIVPLGHRRNPILLLDIEEHAVLAKVGQNIGIL